MVQIEHRDLTPGEREALEHEAAEARRVERETRAAVG